MKTVYTDSGVNGIKNKHNKMTIVKCTMSVKYMYVYSTIKDMNGAGKSVSTLTMSAHTAALHHIKQLITILHSL